MPSRRSIACVIAGLVALAGAACQSTPTPGPQQAPYEQYCAVCHGVDGRTVADMPSTPNLNSQGLLTVVDDAFLTESISAGRPGDNGHGKPGTKMSAFGPRQSGPLTDQEIAEIVGHIRGWQTEPSLALEPYTADGDAAAGAKVFEACVPCHGQDGWSAAAPSLAGDTFQRIASDAFIRHTVLNGRPGTTMPQFKLSEKEVADLIAHIRSLYVPDAD